MYLFLIFTSLNLSYYIVKTITWNVGKLVFNNTYKLITKKKEKINLEDVVKEQAKLICDLQFKINKLENINTTHDYVLIT